MKHKEITLDEVDKLAGHIPSSYRHVMSNLYYSLTGKACVGPEHILALHILTLGFIMGQNYCSVGAEPFPFVFKNYDQEEKDSISASAENTQFHEFLFYTKMQNAMNKTMKGLNKK